MKSQHINMSFFDDKGRLTYETTAYYYRQSTDTINFFRSFYSKIKSKYFEGSIINALDSMDYNNKYAGVCKWYYPNGKLKLECDYNDVGVLDGRKKEFDISGTLIREIIYEKGKIKNKKYTEFDKNKGFADVLLEDFSNNDLNWPVETNETTSSKIKIGGFELLNKTKKDFVAFCERKIDSVNYSIETSLNSNYLTNEAKCGIVFGFKDWNNYNFFYISKFRFYIGFVKDGVTTTQIENFFCYELNGSNWNKIAVQAFQDSLYFSINDKLKISGVNSNVSGRNMGLCINNGNVLFDNFSIKQFHKNILPVIYENRMAYQMNRQLIPINQVNSGVILGKAGYIATSIKNIHQANKIFVELNINDKIRVVEADIFYNSDIFNFTILKIKDSLSIEESHLAYNYNNIRDASNEHRPIFYEYENDSVNNNLKLLKLNGNGDSKKINKHNHNYRGIYNNHSCQGAPIFDSTGNILGIITDVNNQNTYKVITIQQIIGVLYPYPGSCDIKHKTEFNVSEFYDKIYKNVVIVKIL